MVAWYDSPELLFNSLVDDEETGVFVVPAIAGASDNPILVFVKISSISRADRTRAGGVPMLHWAGTVDMEGVDFLDGSQADITGSIEIDPSPQSRISRGGIQPAMHRGEIRLSSCPSVVK